MDDGQRHAFLDGEADAYWRRNAEDLERSRIAALSDPDSDPVLHVLAALKPYNILEVGAANGWRLDAAHHLWGTRGMGVEPSQRAVADGRSRFPAIDLRVGTAEELPAKTNSVDCVVFGFCLYLCDRQDLFRIACEADRVLRDGGFIVVYDFFPQTPYRNSYTHHAGLFAHKMDYSRLWSWHPAYTSWSHEVTAHPGKSPTDPDERLAVSVLRKHA